MDTCEQCGAQAVDAGGRCRSCGWQVPYEADDMAVSSPSLAATRAVETPEPAAPVTRGAALLSSGFDHTVDMPMARATSAGQPPSRTTRIPGAASAPVAQFCGACGARIAAGEAFCGQCGTPVPLATGEYGTAYGTNTGAPSRYSIGASDSWDAADADGLTEAYMPAPRGASQPNLAGAPYGPGGSMRGYGSSPYPAAPAAIESARRTRIAIGLLCIAGGLASAGGAVIVALTQH